MKLNNFTFFLTLTLLLSQLKCIENNFENSQLFLQLPFDHDWRVNMSDCFDIPADIQGKCGSSYSLAVAEALRLRMCIKTFGEVKHKLSAQEILSCGFQQDRCLERNSIDAWSYAQREGLVREECLKYSSESGEAPECEFEIKCEEGKVKAKNIRSFEKEGPIMQEIIYGGPLVATFDMYEDFLTYTSGIYKHKSGKFIGQHSLVLVGYSRSDSSEENDYWIAKNSFGDQWGENGYVKFPFNHLNIEANAFSAEADLDS